MACTCVRYCSYCSPPALAVLSTGCADSLDLGETSYAQVLADDLDGNGKLDLLVRCLWLF